MPNLRSNVNSAVERIRSGVRSSGLFAVMARLKSRCRSASVRSGMTKSSLISNGASLLYLGLQLLPGRDIAITLDHSTYGSKIFGYPAVEIPDLFTYGSVVAVDQIASPIGVSGEMNLANPII